MLSEDIYSITSDNYESVRYILSSNIRTRILLYLSESDKTFIQLKKLLENTQNSNILRAIKELNDLEYVWDNDKIYSLTNTGRIVTLNVITFIKNMNFVKTYKYFLSKHSLDNIPYELLRYIHLLSDSKLIVSDTVDYNKTINFYVDKISNAHNIRVVLPIFSKFHLNAIINTVKNNDTSVELITSELILDAINESIMADTFNDLVNESRIKLYLSKKEHLNLFLTVCDEFYSVSFFYLDKTFDESSLFYSEEIENLDEINMIFDDYRSHFERYNSE